MGLVRRLKHVGGGLVALALGLGAVVGCTGLPDAEPVLAQMREQAAGRGLADRIDYRPLSVGGLGWTPTAVSTWEEASAGDVQGMISLLQENARTSQDAGFGSFRPTVRMTVAHPSGGHTRVELRHVPSEAYAAVLDQLLSPEVAGVQAGSAGSLNVRTDGQAHELLVNLAPAISDALSSEKAATFSISPSGYGKVVDFRFTRRRPLTEAAVRDNLAATRRLTVAAEPMLVERYVVEDGRVSRMTVRHLDFDENLFTEIARTAPSGMELIVHGRPGKGLYAVVDGAHSRPAKSTEEERLRGVVEKRS